MHYYQFNIGDYQSHTKHLSPSEDICYRRLLDFYYLHEMPIANDLIKITRLLCLNKEYADDVNNVLNEFFILTEAGWVNNRADKEIQQIPKPKPPKAPRIIELDNGFNEFWNFYPKKIGKDKAETSWLKIKPNTDDVLKALAWQKESDQWTRDDGQFIPLPATYLNQGRWKDEPTIINSALF
jgi:hypothetical protein